MEPQTQNQSKKRRFGATLLDIIIACSVVVLGIYVYESSNSTSEKIIVEDLVNQDKAVIDKMKFGLSENEYFFETMPLKNNQFIGDILHNNGINYQQISELERKAKNKFSVRKIRAGKDLTIVRKDACAKAVCLIYEPDAFKYVVYDFRDSVNVKLVEKEVHTMVETASGTIKSSLWLALTDRGFSPALIDKMQEALAWSVDFYHTQKGDEFKIIYERKYIDGKPVSIGNLLGAYYKNNKEHYAIHYANEKYQGFYDLEGRPTKKAFLKAPLQGRISSRFSYSRLHPILKRRRPHLGTDYAAPYGTKIKAVADGTVVKASYTRGNGKYVKIKHDKTYQTQYLHMQKFARGIRPGASVSQGETIGYVGSTGLATGPHVCFRFWKNGKQVNHLRENFPPPKPMEENDLPVFKEESSRIVSLLDRIEVNQTNKTDLLASNLNGPFQ